MPTTILDPKISYFNPEVKDHLSKVVSEILTDPDFGLDLSEKVQRRLRQARKSHQTLISFEEIKKKYS